MQLSSSCLFTQLLCVLKSFTPSHTWLGWSCLFVLTWGTGERLKGPEAKLLQLKSHEGLQPSWLEKQHILRAVWDSPKYSHTVAVYRERSLLWFLCTTGAAQVKETNARATRTASVLDVCDLWEYKQEKSCQGTLSHSAALPPSVPLRGGTAQHLVSFYPSGRTPKGFYSRKW